MLHTNTKQLVHLRHKVSEEFLDSAAFVHAFQNFVDRASSTAVCYQWNTGMID